MPFFYRLTTLEAQIKIKPNRITFLSLLSSIAIIPALRLGKEVHACLIRSGLDQETSIGNSLIVMNGKRGEAGKGWNIFQRLPCCDVFSWNSMLSGYAQNNDLISCYELFKEMQISGLEPDLHTLTILLCALSPDSLLPGSCRLGREIHGYVLRSEAALPLTRSVYNAMITMYSKYGRFADAEKIFKGMSDLDSYTWNSMIEGYMINDFFHDAVKLFVEMQRQGFQPDHSTFSIILTVRSKLVSIESGKQLHVFAAKRCLRNTVSHNYSLSINNVLVSMYSKCGSINDAAQVFKRMAKRDVISWTAMITGYAHHGMAHESLEFFKTMRTDGIQPNSVTFLGLLVACAHAGLLKEGMQYFNLMSKFSTIEPSIEHYACMVDLFGRSGHFKEAEAMVQIAVSHLGSRGVSCLWLWDVLLGACHAYKQLELGIRVGARILELDPDDETTHVLLSNFYANFGLWMECCIDKEADEGERIREGSWM